MRLDLLFAGGAQSSLAPAPTCETRRVLRGLKQRLATATRCAPAVEEEISSRSAGILRPHPDDACAAEGDLLSPRARPQARGQVFTPSPTMLGPFAPQRVAAANRGDVAKDFEASCCLPLSMAFRACTCTCDCTATVTPTAVGEHEMGSRDSAGKADGRLDSPSTLAPCCAVLRRLHRSRWLQGLRLCMQH